MMIFNLDFSFKGNRNYIQGADIYNNIITFINNKLKIYDVKKIDMSIHKESNKTLTVEVYKNKENKINNDVSCIFSFYNNHDRYVLLLTETDQLISSRYEYPEEEITKRCLISHNEKEIILTSQPSFTDMEIIVAMNKSLFETVFPSVKKWWFTRLQLHEYIYRTDFRIISLKVLHNFQNRYIKSLIKINETEKGFIYYSKRF